MNSVWCGSPFVASFSSMFGVRCWMFDVPQGQNSGSRLIAPVLGLWPSVLLIAALNVTLLPIAIWRKHEPLRRRMLWIPIPLVAFFVSAAPPGWRGPCRQRRLRRLNGSRLSPWDARELSQRCSAARATGECCSTTVTRSAARRRSLIRNAKALLPLLLSCRPQTVACLASPQGAALLERRSILT